MLIVILKVENVRKKYQQNTIEALTIKANELTNNHFVNEMLITVNPGKVNQYGKNATLNITIKYQILIDKMDPGQKVRYQENNNNNNNNNNNGALQMQLQPVVPAVGVGNNVNNSGNGGAQYFIGADGKQYALVPVNNGAPVAAQANNTGGQGIAPAAPSAPSAPAAPVGNVANVAYNPNAMNVEYQEGGEGVADVPNYSNQTVGEIVYH